MDTKLRDTMLIVVSAAKLYLSLTAAKAYSKDAAIATLLWRYPGLDESHYTAETILDQAIELVGQMPRSSLRGK